MFYLIAIIRDRVQPEFASPLSWYWRKPTTNTSSSSLQSAALQDSVGTFKSFCCGGCPFFSKSCWLLSSNKLQRISFLIRSFSILVTKIFRSLCCCNMFVAPHVQRISQRCGKSWTSHDIWSWQELSGELCVHYMAVGHVGVFETIFKCKTFYALSSAIHLLCGWIRIMKSVSRVWVTGQKKFTKVHKSHLYHWKGSVLYVLPFMFLEGWYLYCLSSCWKGFLDQIFNFKYFCDIFSCFLMVGRELGEWLMAEMGICFQLLHCYIS